MLKVKFNKKLIIMRILILIVNVFGLIALFRNYNLVIEISGLWATYYDILIALALIIGSIFFMKFKNITRILIILCSILNIFDLIYNIVIITEPINIIISSTMIVSMLFYAIVIECFSNPKTLSLINDKEITETTDNEINNSWNKKKYIWRIVVFALLFSSITSNINTSIYIFITSSMSFLFTTLFLSSIVFLVRNKILKKKESYLEISYTISIFIFVLMIFSFVCDKF